MFRKNPVRRAALTSFAAMEARGQWPTFRSQACALWLPFSCPCQGPHGPRGQRTQHGPLHSTRCMPFIPYYCWHTFQHPGYRCSIFPAQLVWNLIGSSNSNSNSINQYSQKITSPIVGLPCRGSAHNFSLQSKYNHPSEFEKLWGFGLIIIKTTAHLLTARLPTLIQYWSGRNWVWTRLRSQFQGQSSMQNATRCIIRRGEAIVLSHAPQMSRTPYHNILEETPAIFPTFYESENHTWLWLVCSIK